MELIHGVPITDFCDDQKLSTRERLRLFVDVCRAVHHAHQKGIIHRDLKPSNILITMNDDKPLPKVIDFGISKALSGQLTDKTLFTAYGQMIGTPLYMSPEQAQFSVTDIDTRSDVYSLGVLLYELLTGTTPFDKETLQKSGLDEMRRIIREDDPPRPSARVSTLEAEKLSTVSNVRKTDPRQLSRSMQHELDWIVMKALEKDRNRRYESASAFAADVERYLKDEPVQACPPSVSYRLRKYVRRNKTVLTTTALVALALLVGTAVSTWQAVHAMRAEAQSAENAERAQNEAEDARNARDETKVALGKATAATADAEAAVQFLVDAFCRADLSQDGRNLKVVDMLEKAVKKLDDEDIKPATRARLLDAVGQTYHGLGLPYEAVKLLERARTLREKTLGPKHFDTLRTINLLCYSYQSAGRYEDAVGLFEQLLEAFRETLGADDTNTLIVMDSLAGAYSKAGRPGDALRLHKTAYELLLKKLGANDKYTLIAMENLAGALAKAGQHDEAIRLGEAALKAEHKIHSDDHLDTLMAMSNLGGSYNSVGRHDEAIDLYKQVIKGRLKELSLVHPDTLVAMSNLAMAYWSVGEYGESLRLNEQVYKIRPETLSKLHPDTLQGLNNLARTCLDMGKPQRAIQLLEDVLKLMKTEFVKDDPTTISTMKKLYIAYIDARNLERSIAVMEDVLELMKTRFGPDAPATLSEMESLAVSYLFAGNQQKSISLTEEVLKLRQGRDGLNHIDTLRTMSTLSSSLKGAGQNEKAISVSEDAWKRVRALPEKDSPAAISARSAIRFALIGAYDAAGRHASSEPLRREQLADARKSGKPSSIASRLIDLGINLIEQKKWAAAEPVLRECVAIREEIAPDSWSTFNAKSVLGECLLAQKRYIEAEKLLLGGFDGMQKRASKGQQNQALERIVRLFEGWGKPDLAAQWKAKRKSPARARKPKLDRAVP